MSQHYFGTDGIRGKVGVSPITPDFALRLGFAAGKALCRDPSSRVVIGKDTRLSCDMLEAALQAGFTAAGVDVFCLGFMPTPGVAYLTRTFHAQLGIVISASHNLYDDNGIKFFSSTGEKLSDQDELRIEAALNETMVIDEPKKIGSIQMVDDAAGRYIEFCKASLPSFAQLKGLKIVVDCAHGATFYIAPRVFQELGADVTVLGCEPDGQNINQGVGSTHPDAIQEVVREEEDADCGIAFDGDGDRVIFCDHEGNLVDGDQILYILAKQSHQEGLLKSGGVVGTHMSNLGLEKALAADGISFVRAQVGDRHVMQMLRELGWYVGGEASGHIIWLNSTTTGDGIVSALQVLHIMKKTGLRLQDLLKGMKKYPQVLLNLKLKTPLTLAQKSLIKTFAQKIDQDHAQHSFRVLIRPSGTEPLVRVMVEGEDAQEVQALAEQLIQEVQELLSGSQLSLGDVR
jgi:phosphoglucosamine mutase